MQKEGMTMSTVNFDLTQGVSEQTAPETTTAGAAFWAYISPQNNTSTVVTDYRVVLTQGSWTGVMTPQSPMLQTPGMSGIFNVEVAVQIGAAIGLFPIKPLPNTKPNIGCNSNCKAMVGIVANEAGNGANYWTVWEALCNGPAKPIEE
jgi:hypothetical protein